MLSRVARGVQPLSWVRMASSYSQHADLLQRLGLSEVNDGVFNGTWSAGKGELIDSVNPATGEVIAQVTQASCLRFVFNSSFSETCGQVV